MKNCKIILPALLLMNINFCFAQLVPNVLEDAVSAVKVLDRFYISLTFGSAIPVGEFAKSDPNPHEFPPEHWITNHDIAGEPRTGKTGRLSASYFFSKYIGCAATLFAGTYKAKSKTWLESKVPINYMVYETNTFTYSTKSWNTNGAMIGFITRTLCDKIAFNIKLLAGLQQAVSPETNVLIERESANSYCSSEESYHRPAVSSTNFAWDAGMELKIKACHKMSVLLSADYISSNASFSDNMEATHDYHNSYYPDDIYQVHTPVEHPFQYSRQISYITLNAGIAYTFK